MAQVGKPCESEEHQEHKEQINTKTKTCKSEEDEAEDEDVHVLKFMDSLDAYLCLIDSLSSTLRQGWFDFASARYSMGASRVNSALLDLKEHSAATSLEVSDGEETHFTLCKWTTSCADDTREKGDCHNGLKQDCNNIRQRHKDASQVSEVEEESLPIGGRSPTADDRVQKERSKSLAVFGTLVSPKLRTAQLSFETALETLVEIANVRASMLSAFNQVQEHITGTKD